MSKKKLMALLLTGVMAASTVSVPVFAEEAEGGSSDTPLVIGQTNFSEKFSGLFHETVPDQQIAENVGEYLFGSDRTGAIIYNGIEGETREYNGTDYTYTGLSDVTVTEGEDETVYNFKLREDVTFSDGEPLTADDLIFTYYVLSDTDYDGNATFYSTNIKGMKNYRLNSTAADSITDEDVANTLADMPDEVAARVKDELMVPLLTSEYEWAQTAWEDYADDYGVANGDEFFAMLYAKDENYSVDGKDQDTIINEIADQYGKDYLALAAAYGDEAFFDEDAATIASEYLVEQKTAAGEGEEVANIEGIKKLGDYEVEVTTDGFEATTIYQLGVIVEPMHYYGDASLYDYDNNQFGFTRGDLSAVRDKSNQPLGAGPYKFVKYENKTVYMEANENYYKGAPKTKYLQWRETSDADKIAGVEQGTIDLSDPSGSKSAFDQIKSINGNAPSKMDFSPSCTMRAGSAFNWFPRPVQVGQAPTRRKIFPTMWRNLLRKALRPKQTIRISYGTVCTSICRMLLWNASKRMVYGSILPLRKVNLGTYSGLWTSKTIMREELTRRSISGCWAMQKLQFQSGSKSEMMKHLASRIYMPGLERNLEASWPSSAMAAWINSSVLRAKGRQFQPMRRRCSTTIWRSEQYERE